MQVQRASMITFDPFDKSALFYTFSQVVDTFCKVVDALCKAVGVFFLITLEPRIE